MNYHYDPDSIRACLYLARRCCEKYMPKGGVAVPEVYTGRKDFRAPNKNPHGTVKRAAMQIVAEGRAKENKRELAKEFGVDKDSLRCSINLILRKQKENT